MVIGNPILLGKPDTFIAALYAEKTGSSIATLGWDFVAERRASVENNIVTLTLGGNYRITMWRYMHHQSIGSGTLAATILHNSKPVTSGDVISANAGDTIRVRASVNSTDPRNPAVFTIVVLVEQYEE